MPGYWGTSASRIAIVRSLEYSAIVSWIRKTPFSWAIAGGSIFLVSNIGVMLFIALIKSRYLLGTDFLKTISITAAVPWSDLYPPLSGSTEERSNNFLQYNQGFDSL
jgi:hypothetical protein